MHRRRFLQLSVAGAAVAASQAAATAAPDRTAPPVSPTTEGNLAWYDVTKWGVEGRGWSDTEQYFDRFPKKAHGVVRDPVWNLSRNSAGMLARFETDAPTVRVRYVLRSASLALPHMPATGVSGVDLYARDEKGEDRWLAVSMPNAQRVEAQLASGIDALPGGRLYTLYLPLYNGVETLEIGVPTGTQFRPVAPRAEKPLVMYGTSILHGACASRPGMAFTAILGRRFHLPVINLGFSGNGQMEPEVGALLAELDPVAYAIDCLPNMSPEMVAARAEPLVRQLRAAHPETPILLVEDRTLTNAEFYKGTRDSHAQRRAALRGAYDALVKSGVRHLSYMRGEDQLGSDGEGATDGSHPNDLGMVRYADTYEKALRHILPKA